MFTSTLARYSSLALMAFAAAALAAPAQAGPAGRARTRAPANAAEQRQATCVDGTPTSSSPYRIDYAAVAAPATGGSYDIETSFGSAHAVGEAMDLYVKPDGDMHSYASFKCQYACNGTPGCVSFFGRFVQVNSTTEHFECLTFGALLDESAFTSTSRNIPNGGFNKLCT